jgi:hypothetical protein
MMLSALVRRAPEYVAALRECATVDDGQAIVIDTESECYKRLHAPPVAPARSRGLGDTVAKAIHKVTRGAVQPCGGCKKRQAALNKLVPYKKRDATNLREYFDRVVLLNLKRRPDRLEETNAMLATIGWPFQEPQRFDAVDGRAIPIPDNWPRIGGREGSYGCMLSHRNILQQAIQEGVETLLVIEDDVELKADFPLRVADFLRELPDDWEMIQFGGQNFARPEQVKPGVLRCINTQRTHMYAVRGNGMRELYKWWAESTGHCDHRLKEWQPKHRVYMPEQPLAGQRPSRSDIAGGNKGSNWWARQVKPKPPPIEMHTEWFAEMVKGKTVAVVGNAPTANEFDHAQRIEAADVVVRFNRFQTGEKFPNVGTRTDVLAVPLGHSPAIPPDAELERIAPRLILACCPPQTEHRGDERDKNYLRLRDKYRIAWLPFEELTRIKGELGKRPTTGLFLLDWLMERCEPASVYVTGFSFARLPKDHYFGGPFAHHIHDVHREWEYVARRWERWQGRLSVDPHMAGKLNVRVA